MRKCFHGVATIAVAICFCRSVAGYAVEEPQDTESMAVQSRIVLEGVIGQSWGGSGDLKVPQHATRLKITQVIAGPFATVEPINDSRPDTRDFSEVKLKSGDEIDISGVGGAITEDPDGGKQRPLGSGDKVIVFLRHRGDRNSSAPNTSADWITIGLRYVNDENAYAFKEVPGMFGPGPSLTATRANFPDIEPLTRRDFITRVRKACDDAPKLRWIIDHATRDDTELLLEMCRSRKDPERGEIVASGY